MLSNTAAVQNQPITFSNISVENRRAEPFTIRDGRYIGQDGFVVPKDFDEFHERFPHYVRKWVRKHADNFAQPEDLEDWTQDLLLHLKCLPPTSKLRASGKTDIVQTFDPSRHYGASQPRFQNYINLCLDNKFRNMYAGRTKNPLCRPGNLSFSEQIGEDSVLGSDQYCHTHSTHLRKLAEQLERGEHARLQIAEIADFVRRMDAAVLPILEAILLVGTQPKAARFLGVSEYHFVVMYGRLLELARCFVNGDPVTKRRSPYGKWLKSDAACRQ
jgi:hypothetical protein